MLYFFSRCTREIIMTMLYVFPGVYIREWDALPFSGVYITG